MKILMFEPDVYYTEEGGDSPSIHLRELASHLRMDHDLTVIARRPRDHTPSDRNIRLIRGIPLPFLATPTYAFTGFLKGLRTLLRNRPDVIYARHHVVGTGILLGKLFRVPVVSEMNGMLVDEAEACGSYGRLLRRIARCVERIVLKRAARIVAVSPGVKRGLMERYRIPDEKITVVENGANTDMFHPDIPREDGGVLRVGFSGSFNAWHGVEELIRSIPLVLEEFQNVRFVFLGDGPLRRRAVRLAGELGLGGAAEFADRVSYENAPRHVASFDVGVILKRKDIPGSPLKLWEYMAAGKPVVATDADDFAMLRDRNAGVLTDPQKPEEVAQAILSLLQDDDMRKEMGANGSRYAAGHRSWEHVAAEIAAVLQETAGAGGVQIGGT